MKVAVVRNRKNQHVVSKFGTASPERYGRRSVQAVMNALRAGGHTVRALEGDLSLQRRLKKFMPSDPETGRPGGIVFNLTYGIQGEARYAHVPTLLEMAGVPYTGSGPVAHKICLDKVLTKIILDRAGIATPRFHSFARPDEDIGELRFPMIVKPRHESTSLGLEVVYDEAHLRDAVAAVIRDFHQEALVEEYVDGREFAISLVGNPPEVLPLVELDFGDRHLRVLSKKDKFHKTPDEPEKLCPAPVSESLRSVLEEQALAVWRACQCRDYARIDVRVDSEGQPWVLEINSMASLGQGASTVLSARVAGFTFDEFVCELLNVTHRRYFGTAAQPDPPPELDPSADEIEDYEDDAEPVPRATPMIAPVAESGDIPGLWSRSRRAVVAALLLAGFTGLSGWLNASAPATASLGFARPGSVAGSQSIAANKDGESLTESSIAARLSAAEAVATALNDVSPTEKGYLLRHPGHNASFEASGVTFQPRDADLPWHWQLTYVGPRRNGLKTELPSPVRPLHPTPRSVTYMRAELEEHYLMHARNMEQRFVLSRPPDHGGADLEIVGSIDCPGELEPTKRGWVWFSGDATVSLGNVHVFDARGKTVPAMMAVSDTESRIIVDGDALASAVYPVTIDPIISTDDLRISDMGPDGDIDFDAQDAAVAYNSVNNEYLVVWAADDNELGVIEGEFEIFGQRISAATGAELGLNDFRISDAGPAGDDTYDATAPAVAYNPTQNQYLVVWSADDNQGLLANGEDEIFGQLIDGATGAQVGTNDFRISAMGPEGDPMYDAVSPDVAYNFTAGEYLVVWQAEHNTGALAVGEFEIFGQRLEAVTGASIGAIDFRISSMGPDGDSAYDAREPAVAYNGIAGEYLVVWHGDDNTPPLVEGEFEIFGQRINAATGAEVGTDDFRISDMGPDGFDIYDAAQPDVAFGSGSSVYLVVWQGDEATGGRVVDEIEIHGQLLSGATAAAMGPNDFRISDMGPDGDVLYEARRASVDYNGVSDEFLVTWQGDDDHDPLVEGEFEIYLQRIQASSGVELGSNDVRLSSMGTDGDRAYDAASPVLAVNATSGTALVVWEGDQDTLGLANEEFEIYSQLIDAVGNQIGVDDQRLSDMGPDGDIDYDAGHPAVSYNPVNQEFLVVWEGDDTTGTLVDGESEIFAQRVDAVSGLELGANDFRISHMGPDGDPAFDAIRPASAYNSVSHEYLVVWSGETGLTSGEFEIYGQRLDATTGAEIGSDDFRISDMGPDGSDIYDAELPAVAHNPIDNTYLVVWRGDDSTTVLVDGESEIFGQLLAGATGAEIGVNDFRISSMGPDGDNLFDADEPDVIHNPTNNEFLVVWEGEDNTGGLVQGEFEIFAQRLSGGSATPVGADNFRVSDMGPNGDPNFDAHKPSAVYNPNHNEYLVAWSGENDEGDVVVGEFEIYGQRISAVTGAAVGANDFRISDMGPPSDPLFDADRPGVAYDSVADRYLVVWEGDDNATGTVDGESEIFAQLLNGADATETGTNDFRISGLNQVSSALFDAFQPAVVRATQAPSYAVVWIADVNLPPLHNDEFEIYAQLFTGLVTPTCPVPFTGDVNASGVINSADIIYAVNYVFKSGAEPLPCAAAADVNCNGAVNSSDIIFMVGYVFKSGPAPCDVCMLIPGVWSCP